VSYYFIGDCCDKFLLQKMGKLLSKIFGNKEMRILMLGLDAAGKTSILVYCYILYITIYKDTSFSSSI